MKKVLKNNLLFLTLLTVLFSYGAEKSLLKDDLRAKMSYVIFKDVKKGSLLQLKNFSNEIIYTEEITKPGYYAKRFDFTFLPQGSYVFELVKDLEINTKSFEVHADSVIFENESTPSFYRPYVTLKGSKVLISQLSLEKHPLKIKLFYENGVGGYDLIYSETLRGDMVLTRILKLSEKRKGAYKVVLFSDNHKFEETLNLF